MQKLEWNDYLVILKIAECGSLSGAARLLKTSQSTVSRRLRDIEEKARKKLFFFKDGIYSPTPGAGGLLKKARAMEKIVHMEDETNTGLPRPVRLTTTEILSSLVLLPGLEGRSIPPLQILNSSSREDLKRKGIDIALRLDKPSVSGLYKIKRLGELLYYPYTAKKNAHRLDLKWLYFGDEYSHMPDLQWFRKNVKGTDIHSLTVNSYLGLAKALEHIDGIAILPQILGDSREALTRIRFEAPVFRRSVWMVVREEALTRPEVRVLKDQIIEIFDKGR